MNADLMVRIIGQAQTYGALMLTVDEFVDLLAVRQACPNAAIALSAGHLVPLNSLTVHVLPDLDETLDQ